MKKEINPKFKFLEEELTNSIENFNTNGTVFIVGKRNMIKLFEINNLIINIKSFKVPNFINKIIYRYFRKSKARRSFEFVFSK